MYFAKRASLYVRRKWGKVLTVGIILFVVSTLVLTGLLIRSASQSTFEVARNKLGGSVVYTTDLSSVMGTMGGERPTNGGRAAGFEMPDDFTQITTKEIETIANNSKYIKNYTIAATLAGSPTDFSYYDPSGSDDETTENENGPGINLKSSANINIVGVDVKSKDSTFNSDSNTLVEGRYFTDEEVTDASKVIIIEKTIADLNGIKVGDTITIERQNKMRIIKTTDGTTDVESEDSVEITYEVVGVYKTSNPTDVTSSNFMGAFNLTENTMYAPYTTVLSASLEGLTGDELTEEQAKIEENGYEVRSVTFNLKSPTDIEPFIEEVKNMTGIDTTYRSLNANDQAYEQMVGPIENVANTSTVLVIVVVIAGAFIIGLLSMLSIKDRKYELGVLLSLGESRMKIVSQLICEMLMVAVISFGLATLVSNFTSQVTTNFLLNQEIESLENQENDNNNNFGGQFGGGMFRIDKNALSNVDVDTIDTLTVGLNIDDILAMFGIGIIIIVVGNIIQAMFVLRCNPKEILLER